MSWSTDPYAGVPRGEFDYYTPEKPWYPPQPAQAVRAIPSPSSVNPATQPCGTCSCYRANQRPSCADGNGGDVQASWTGCIAWKPGAPPAPFIPSPVLRAYQQVPAGNGFATVLPDFDFESYSEAGYYWDGPACRWRGVTKTKPGIFAVGAAVYTEHPSCEVISLAYDLKDGQGDRLWTPGNDLPFDLFNHILTGHLLEAWNSSFEYYLWRNVCHLRMGWPALDYRQLRCAMSKARAFSLPGALGNAAKALGAGEQKDTKGDALIKKLTVPRSPTKKQIAAASEVTRAGNGVTGILSQIDAELRNVNRATPATYPQDFADMYAYNRQDIKAEASVSMKVPDLIPRELELWLTDQAINFRGVHIDQVALNNCIAIFNQANEKYTAELQAITGGVVQGAGELAKIIEWLGAHGIHTPNLDSDAVDAALARTDLSPACRRVLEIRDALGGASVKKLFAIERMLTRDGRLHDLFAFCGADRTARWAGRGPQPQNLPSSGPKVCRCKGCNHVSWKGLVFCPNCGLIRGPFDACDWGNEATESALADIATRSLAHVEARWGNALAAVSGCLRGLFSAAPGHDLICSDFSAIEAVGLGELAGEEWRQEVFRTHGKIYEMSAAKITGTPFEDFAAYKAKHGQHHPLRKKVGKVSELACFTRETQVLTKEGLKRIADVTKNDLLWDGVEWVKSCGAIYKGKKEVISLDGVGVTPNHPISLGSFWRVAGLLASKKNILRRALAFGSENIPLSAMKTETGDAELSASVAAGQSGSWISRTCIRVTRLVAALAAGKNLKKLGSRNTQSTRTLSPTQNIGGGSLTVSGRLSPAAVPRATEGTRTTAGAGSPYTLSGPALTGRRGFSSTSSPWTAGIMQVLKWTVSTRIKGTPPVISDLLAGQTTCSTSAALLKCKNELTSLRDVYDIVNAGPRHRFTIKTDSGYLIVHNSGYGGGLGAWKAFGADEFMTDDEIRENVKAWRKASPMVVKLWYGLQDAAYAAVQSPGYAYSYQAPATRFTQPPAITYIVQKDILYCYLPSGRTLTYHSPRLEEEANRFTGRNELRLTYMGWNSNYLNGPIGWVRLDTWGGKLTENIDQAMCRDLLAHNFPALEQSGYPIVLHVHDEIVSEVPEGTGDVKEFERIMSTTPPWAQGWPVKAAGGWRGKRYRKE